MLAGRGDNPHRRHNGADARCERKSASDEGLPVVDPIPKARGVPRRLRDLDRDHALVLLSGARALIGTTLASGFGMTNDAHASITGRRSASRSLRS